MKKILLVCAAMVAMCFGAVAQSVDTTKFHTADTMVAGVRIINVDLNANWNLNNPKDTVAINKLPLVTIKGHVVDSVMQENYPFIYIDAIQGDSIIAKTYTDFDGNFVMRLPAGEYVLKFSSVGCYRQMIAIIADKNTDMGTITMVVSAPFFYDDPHIDNYHPIIEIDPNGATQQMEIEGINVIAR